MAEYEVRREIGMRLVSPESAMLQSIWLYDSADPWGVHVELHWGLAEPVRWVFGRDLLTRGVYAPAGLGDVQVFPYRGRVAVGLCGEGADVLMTARPGGPAGVSARHLEGGAAGPGAARRGRTVGAAARWPADRIGR